MLKYKCAHSLRASLDMQSGSLTLRQIVPTFPSQQAGCLCIFIKETSLIQCQKGSPMKTSPDTTLGQKCTIIFISQPLHYYRQEQSQLQTIQMLVLQMIYLNSKSRSLCNTYSFLFVLPMHK